MRLLGRFDVPAQAVDALLGLYRAARYSAHPLGEDDRAAAMAALQEIGGGDGAGPGMRRVVVRHLLVAGA